MIAATMSALRALIESLPQPAFLTDDAGRITHTNRAWQQAFDLTADRALGHRWRDRLTAEDRARVVLQWRAATGSELPLDLEFRIRVPSGELRTIRVQADRIRGLAGAHGYVGTAADLSDLRRVETALAEERNRLAGILDGTQAGTWEWHVPSGKLLVNERWVAILGWTLTEWAPVHIDEVDERTHPEDLVEADDILDRHFAGELPHYEHQMRMRHRDGSWVWVLDRARVVSRTPAGDPDWVAGTHLDITTLKDQEFRLRATIDELEAARQDLAFRAAHDELTGLANRAEFDRLLARALRSSRTSPGTVLFIDLDQFKLVNDTCGHAVGDRLLREVAAILAGCVGPRDVLARLGGDEFGVLLPGCDTERGAAIADDICHAIDHYRLVYDGRSFRVGASVGLVAVDPHWETPQEMLQAADSACYAAKDQGRNRVFVWSSGDPELDGRSGHTRWAARLGEALDNDGFVLFGQRLVPLTARDPGLWAEVLLRLPDGNGDLLTPGVFLPAAERFDLSSRIDRWVLQRVLGVMSRQVDLSPVALLTVNLSARSTGDPAFRHEVISMLADTPLAVRRRLCLEISESTSPTTVETARPFIEQVRALGVRIALDDFGSGLSSFSFLKNVPIDLLKIDGQFVQGMVSDPVDAVTVRSFVDLAELVGVRTVAEQVADPEVLEYAQNLGIDFGQGFLLHRPEPLERLLAPDGVPIPSARRAPTPTADLRGR
ncbi:MAG: EAL domain-containing protein [Candidatus Nanopelagicales bacterium]